MVVFASLISAVAIYARVASAVPTDYSSSSGYGSSPPPANSSGNNNANGYGSGGSSMPMPMSTMSMPTMSMSMPPAASPTSTPSYSTPSYGSGSSSWNSGGDYNNCVQQCMTQFGSPPSMNMNSSSTPPSKSNGNGVTHTVIVAPTQGVLRYVPFALNASVGDTVMFMWGANNHTVTKSSQLELCNKTSDTPFASGEQNKSFIFSQVVNDTNPTFYYCGTPTHCEKGMFGIINPPNAYQQPTSLNNMLPSLASQNPSTNASWSYATNMTASNPAAANWGNNIDMSKMPQWSQSYVAENAMYARAFFAANPDTIDQNGNVNLSALGKNPTMYPQDVAAMARQNNAASPSSSPTSSGVTPTPSSSTSGALKSGAIAIASPRLVVALVAVAAAFFAL